MPIEITACRTPEETIASIAPVGHYFGTPLTAPDHGRFIPFVEPARAFTARDDGAVVGGCASFPFELTIPGGTVRAAGVTTVGVFPTHRRRGILRAMMRAQLDDVHRRGEPVAALWASEDTIYGRFGYGMASMSADMDLPKPAAVFAQPFEPRGAFRLVDEAEALATFPAIYERVRPEQPGMVERSPEWWRNRRLADPEHRRPPGGGELNRVLLTLDGRADGYALYRFFQKFEGGASVGHVLVVEAVAAGDEATRELWRYLLDIDWVAHIRAMLLPIDHPLWLLLARPRLMGMHVHDGLWIRIVDVPAALAPRRLQNGDPVVIDVADDFCPWNAGRWRIGPGDGGAAAERTTADADLACDVTTLGSVYLGGFSFQRLVRGARAVELRRGAAARADALFATPIAPWCPEIF